MNEQELSAHAEEVRAYLVALRGGAPFLSGSDGRLLVKWLDSGVPVPTILSALDIVSERRRKRRTKSRLTLGAAKREVTKAVGSTTPAAAKPPGHQPRALDMAREAFMTDLAAMPGAEAFPGPRDALVAAVAAATGADATDTATRIIGACRLFHEATWETLPPSEQEALRGDARESLSGLASSLDAAILTDLIEEAARNTLRARFPLVSAREAWARLGGDL
jgi:hypothetical protein